MADAVFRPRSNAMVLVMRAGDVGMWACVELPAPVDPHVDARGLRYGVPGDYPVEHAAGHVLIGVGNDVADRVGAGEYRDAQNTPIAERQANGEAGCGVDVRREPLSRLWKLYVDDGSGRVGLVGDGCEQQRHGGRGADDYRNGCGVLARAIACREREDSRPWIL